MFGFVRVIFAFAVAFKIVRALRPLIMMFVMPVIAPIIAAVMGVFSFLSDQLGLLSGFGLTMGVVVPLVVLGVVVVAAKIA